MDRTASSMSFCHSSDVRRGFGLRQGYSPCIRSLDQPNSGGGHAQRQRQNGFLAILRQSTEASKPGRMRLLFEPIRVGLVDVLCPSS